MHMIFKPLIIGGEIVEAESEWEKEIKKTHQEKSKKSRFKEREEVLNYIFKIHQSDNKYSSPKKEEVKMEQKQATILKATEVAFAKCECCGLTEECTEEYIKRVRDRYSGRWICGLCAEAVKDEVMRSEKRIGNEEALNQHMTFCKKFITLSPPKNPTEDLISAVKQLLFRSLDSPRSSPVKKPGLIRSENCVPAMDS